jgi:hypothetical protein
MKKRTWLVTGAAMALTLMVVSGVWGGLVLANGRTNAKTVDCCDDPACPPGCSEVCPADCVGSRCCEDPACAPGCCEECPPDCLDAAAKTKTTTATSLNKKAYCPPCPFCP